ncbi:MAG: hypothetical protein AB7T06_40115 [Kofleriaceae bacterium]
MSTEHRITDGPAPSVRELLDRVAMPCAAAGHAEGRDGCRPGPAVAVLALVHDPDREHTPVTLAPEIPVCAGRADYVTQHADEPMRCRGCGESAPLRLFSYVTERTDQ